MEANAGKVGIGLRERVVASGGDGKGRDVVVRHIFHRVKDGEFIEGSGDGSDAHG